MKQLDVLCCFAATLEWDFDMAGGGPSVAVPRPVHAKIAHRQGGGTAAQAPHTGTLSIV